MSTNDILTWVGVAIAVVAGVATLAPVVNRSDPDKTRDWTGGVLYLIGIVGIYANNGLHIPILLILSLGVLALGAYISKQKN